MTKALKLLYLIDETAYGRTGGPVTWMDYKVGEMGPVAEELYEALRHERYLLEHGKRISLEAFIRTSQQTDQQGRPLINIEPKRVAEMDDFSSFEKELIDHIIDRSGTYTRKQLINLLHEENTLWHKEVRDNDLALTFLCMAKKATIPSIFQCS